MCGGRTVGPRLCHFVVTVRRKAPPANLRGTQTAQVTEHILALVQQLDGELTRSELQASVGLTHREHFRKVYLLPALEAGLIEMTQPDKPNSRSQRYRLTPAGNGLRAHRGDNDVTGSPVPCALKWTRFFSSHSGAADPR